MSRFERGKHLPSLKTPERLAGELATTIADLLAEQPVGADDDALIITAWGYRTCQRMTGNLLRGC